jgi:hypothetical protein
LALAGKIKDEGRIQVSKGGALYAVDIRADRERMLDWDKTLIRQSKQVKESLRKLGFDPDGEDATMPANGLIDLLGGDQRSSPEASKALADAGIPGIQYLDAGSRDGGDGTRNFVIFDDKRVSIREINGKPIASDPYSPPEPADDFAPPTNDVDAQVLEGMRAQLGDLEQLPEDIRLDLETADQLEAKAANLEPAARRAVACAMGA